MVTGRAVTGRDPSIPVFWRITKACILAFVGFVGALIVASCSRYFPPQFQFGFLAGREAYFYPWYAAAFYAHVISAPVALFSGLVQSSTVLRRRFPRFHRRVGYLYAATVLMLLVPSGLAMSIKAAGGTASILGFASLSIVTGIVTWMGFNAARRKRFAQHGRWMTRSYILVCSAVLLRFIAAATVSLGIDFIPYAAMAWLCWLPTLLLYEFMLRWKGMNHAKDSR